MYFAKRCHCLYLISSSFSAFGRPYIVNATFSGLFCLYIGLKKTNTDLKCSVFC